MKSFPQRLSSAIQENNESAYSLSKKTGVSEATIGRLVKGVNRPAETTIRILADGLSVNYDWLAFGKGPKKIDVLEGLSFTNMPTDDSTLGNRLVTFMRAKDLTP